jgi:hypothetical protein
VQRVHKIFNIIELIYVFQDMVKKGSLEYPKLPLLQLSSANVDRNGAYLLDTGDTIYLYLGSAVNPQFCQDVFDRPNFASIQEGGIVSVCFNDNRGPSLEE